MIDELMSKGKKFDEWLLKGYNSGNTKVPADRLIRQSSSLSLSETVSRDLQDKAL